MLYFQLIYVVGLLDGFQFSASFFSSEKSCPLYTIFICAHFDSVPTPVRPTLELTHLLDDQMELLSCRDKEYKGRKENKNKNNKV